MSHAWGVQVAMAAGPDYHGSGEDGDDMSESSWSTCSDEAEFTDEQALALPPAGKPLPRYSYEQNCVLCCQHCIVAHAAAHLSKYTERRSGVGHTIMAPLHDDIMMNAVAPVTAAFFM